LRETALPMSKNLKTALVLTSVVIAFFVGVIIRHWLWPSP
jgi:multisubunit Na+/H+ antiporter MnhC subunit